MRVLIFLWFAMLVACNHPQVSTQKDDSAFLNDSIEGGVEAPDTERDIIDAKDKVYSNERFKEVRITRVGDDTYQVSGKAQVFEAAFGWVVEDGHHELKQGHEMTDAGAPEFGKFSFTFSARKLEPNTTLHLILFEVSARDGSRQHELAVPLP